MKAPRPVSCRSRLKPRGTMRDLAQFVDGVPPLLDGLLARPNLGRRHRVGAEQHVGARVDVVQSAPAGRKVRHDFLQRPFRVSSHLICARRYSLQVGVTRTKRNLPWKYRSEMRANGTHLELEFGRFDRVAAVVGAQLFLLFLEPLFEVVALAVEARQQDGVLQVAAPFLRTFTKKKQTNKKTTS